MIYNETKIRVRYSETDKMGYVYHSNYLIYYEVGRTELIRGYGLTYDELEKSGIMLPVVSVQCNFKKPAYYDDLLTIKTIIKEKPTFRINFEYEVTNPKGELINTGTSTLVFINTKTRRPCKPPPKFYQQIEKYFET